MNVQQARIVPDSDVLDAMSIPAESRGLLERLEGYDLSFLTNSFNDDLHRQGRVFSNEQIYPIIQHFGRIDRPLAERIELEFKRFVALTILEPGVVHAPSGPVDMYWHFFILHTKDYRNFCERIWGAFEPGA